MGKHERGIVQEVEESLVSLMVGGPSLLAPDHPWKAHDEALAAAILEDYPELRTAVPQGNQYSAPGDIKLVEHGTLEPTYVEIKVSDSTGNLGTAANLSQNALTKYGIVRDVPSWSDFRRSHDYTGGLRAILDQYAAARAVTTIEDKGRAIRDAAHEGDTEAQAVREAAIEYANEDRLAYLELIERIEIDGRNLRFLTLAVLLGAHTEGEVKELHERGLPTSLDDVPNRYVIYYTNVRNDEIIVRKHGRNHIDPLLELTDFELDIDPQERFTCHIMAIADGRRVQILRFIPHWKNVFIGIKTPCLNVFLGKYPRQLLDE